VPDVLRYEVDQRTAWLTMNRPQVRNAQDSELIDALDAALDRAEADDGVRVVVLAAAGDHFSAGHDLKSLLAGEGDPWRELRETPEGKHRHELVMFYERCLRLYHFRKPTIAAVQAQFPGFAFRRAQLNNYVLILGKSRFLQSRPERCNEVHGLAKRFATEKADNRQRRLLRAHTERQRERRTTSKRDEVPSPHRLHRWR